ncbi:MAG TPA: hypothetical protein PKM43_15415 [Verrucomicrobiota bacterium]|nr:hypothetical protein [Verrucomicrobiota bacterium]HRZ35163.1 hypothetical protein [Candidatus Paceibacterota bacterium]HRZ54095.1 hypothetical protein [Candidatus Paceibacterota bacterium]
MRGKHVITALIVALTLGLHWAALQSVAWVSMFVRYSQNTTFREAIDQTFDGRHPCVLCHIVTEGQKSEENGPREPQPQRPLLKLDLICETPRAFMFRQMAFASFELRAENGLERFERPPSPPPRHV